MSETNFKSIRSEVQFCKGVGPRLAKVLAKLDIFTIEDLIFHTPRRYENRTNLPLIRFAQPGSFVSVMGKVLDIEVNATRGGMKIIRAFISDESGNIALTWFNQPWLEQVLRKHEGNIIAYGQVKTGTHGLEIHSPEWETLDEESDTQDFARIVPIYPLVDGLYQKSLRQIVKNAVENYIDIIQDPIPVEFLKKLKLRPLQWSILQIHWPENEQNRIQARERLVFDEFFNLQLKMQMRRANDQKLEGISFNVTPIERTLWNDIQKILPFELTGAQKRVIKEIWTDMQQSIPMNRLVQGDVGSGKTVVAACAALAAIRNGHQVALMAPTEILSIQHYFNIARIFEPLGISTKLLVSKQKITEKRNTLESVADGTTQLLVGTHAIIQDQVQFKNLGLAIIDEQHRFGVLQRAALRNKGINNPDMLVMTATPIPRTLTMTLYGDLNLSVIDELPPGRQAIKTYWKLPSERLKVYAGVRQFLQEGRQAYFVCPIISENEKLQTQAAEDLYYRLTTYEFADLKVGLLHGQMKPAEKEQIMEQFRANKINILVATVVIEVGVDVPNATVMVIEDANRFGLSQLHQLRGRVGRGSHQSYCLLVSGASTEESKKRLEVMTQTCDGFKIAEEDLKLRGPGELIGTRQSGNLDFKLADLVQDGKMLEIARQAAMNLLSLDPDLSFLQHQLIKRKLDNVLSHQALITIS